MFDRKASLVLWGFSAVNVLLGGCAARNWNSGVKSEGVRADRASKAFAFEARVESTPVKVYLDFLKRSLSESGPDRHAFIVEEFRPTFEEMAREWASVKKRRETAGWKASPARERKLGRSAEELARSVEEQLAQYANAPIRYRPFLLLCADWSLLVSDRAWRDPQANGAGRTYDDFDQHSLALKLIARIDEGSFHFPVPTFSKLGYASFFPLLQTELYWIGLTSEQELQIDGMDSSPIDYYTHDHKHASGMVWRFNDKEPLIDAALVARKNPKIVDSAAEAIERRRKPHVAALFDLLRESDSAPGAPGARLGLEQIFFTAFHELGDIAPPCENVATLGKALQQENKRFWTLEKTPDLFECLSRPEQKEPWFREVEKNLHLGKTPPTEAKSLRQALDWLAQRDESEPARTRP